MKRIYKLIIGVLVIFLIIFGAYLYDLHVLAVAGNEIFEQRCTTVNPPLIAYKKTFLNFADSVKNADKYTSEEAAGFYISYLQGIRDYYPKEDEWVKTQTDFINRWDFKLIEPWYIKEAGQYQVLMYEGYRDEAKATVEAMDGKITNEEFNAKFAEARDKRNKYTDLYNEVFDKALPIHDWRKIFGSVPVPAGCNDSNLMIPDTSGALEPDPPKAKNGDKTG